MPLAPGTHLGPYEIASPLGAGGMGEVYRARDLRLERTVAIKILPQQLSNDPVRKQRFEREAKTISRLNHPHICTLHDIGSQDGVDYLVMECIEGETLATRLEKGAMPLELVLKFGTQIADALDKAHRAGIVHRDLKPRNIILTRTGAKLLDFGLAKVKAHAVLSDATVSVNHSITGEGNLVGTLQYMAPEQLEGKEVDSRADIFALGSVIYEMTTGSKAFQAGSQASLIAKILESNPPPMLSFQPIVPPALQRLVNVCLAKDPDERWQSAADLARELKWIDEASRSTAEPDGRASTDVTIKRRYRAAVLYRSLLTAAILLFGSATALLLWKNSTQKRSGIAVTRTSILLPKSERLTSDEADYPLAISPDGRRFVFVSEQDTDRQLYVREMGDFEARPLAGTFGARHPFFSPDGHWVGFFAAGTLQRTSIFGGAPLRICAAPGLSMGASWGADGTIVFATRFAGLSKVSAAGGVPQVLEGTSRGTWPQILPDNRTVLFSLGNGLATIPLNGGQRRILARTNDASSEGPALLGAGYILQARFIPPGYLVYGQSPGVIRALHFELDSLNAVGPPVSIVDSVERAEDGGAVYFVVSDIGSLLYVPTGEHHQMVWVDRNGDETPVSSDRLAFRNPRVSPDGKSIAVAISDEIRRSDIWIYDARGGAKRRMTNEGHNLSPLWEPDGNHITFSSDGNIAEMWVRGEATKETLMPAERSRFPCSWSSDGKDLIFGQSETADYSLWRSPRNDSLASPTLLIHSIQECGLLSPNGGWIAYVSNESGRSEVYVSRYPGPGEKIAISKDGGKRPQWSRDGRELFYRQGESLMAVTLDTGANFHVEQPHRLFAGHYSGESQEPAFDASPDGKKFLMIKGDEASTLRQVNVVMNWTEELRQKILPDAK